MERRKKIYIASILVIVISLVVSIYEVTKASAVMETANISNITTTVMETEPTTLKRKKEKIIKKDDVSKEVESAKESTTKATTTKQTTTKWSGPVLTPYVGTIQGPSGKETFYNLDMSKCIENIRSLGYKGDVWVRDDGAKMFGKYIMVAANLKIRPYGTILPTSLGTGIVVDTGKFAETNPYQLDVAVTWIV